MKKSITLVLLAFLVCALMGSCQKNAKDMKQLQALVEQINSKGETTLDNGTVLTKCEYQSGDSLLTYYIKVKDNRFDDANVDSIKSTLARDLKSEHMSRLTKLLTRNDIGLQYVYSTPSKEISIVFDQNELKGDK